jgi:hypothetical protein
VQLGYFAVPVDTARISNYAVYVRNPVDLSTIKAKLDGCTVSTNKEISSATAAAILATANAAGGSYRNYGQFLGDLRRMFANAINYNSKHMDTDSTGISKLVYEAAIYLQEKVCYSLTQPLRCECEYSHALHWLAVPSFLPSFLHSPLKLGQCLCDELARYCMMSSTSTSTSFL